MKKCMLIYKITFPNGKIYVGRTRDLETRVAFHMRAKTIVGKVMRLYKGQCEVEELFSHFNDMIVIAKEIYYIKTLKATDRSVGYNISWGGFYDIIASGKKKPRPHKGDYKAYLQRRYGLVLKRGRAKS